MSEALSKPHRELMLAFRSAIALGIIALLSACGEEMAPPSRASSPIVENASTGRWNDGERWTIDELWRIGGTAAPNAYVFSDGGLALSIGSDGKLVVADSRGGSLRVYDGQGLFVQDMGRQGRGPGEWLGPVAIGWDSDDRLWVADHPNARYTLYDSAGTYLSQYRRWPHGIPRLPWKGAFDATGAFLDQGTIDLPSDRRGLLIVRVGAEGGIVDSLPAVAMPHVPTFSPGGGERMASGPPTALATFRPRLIYEVTPTDIWFTDSRELRLIKRAHSGDTLLIAETDHRNELRLSQDEQRRIFEELEAVGGTHMDSIYRRQIAQSLHVLDDGHVLVQIQEQNGTDGSGLDVFTPEGVFLGTLDVGFPIDVTSTIVSRSDTLFMVGRDQMDAKFVSRLVIRREVSPPAEDDQAN